jgi:ribosomal subunit interface protein
MEIKLVSRHGRASPSLRDSIASDLDKLERFSKKITSCHVILDAVKQIRTAEITMHVFDREIVAVGRADTVGKAFYSALEKIERQLIKINQKIKDHKYP